MSEDLDHLTAHMVQQNARLIEARDRLKAFIESVQSGIDNAQDMFARYDIRAERLYAQLLDANAEIQKSTEAIAGAAGHGVEQLRGEMDNITKQASTVVDVMMAVQRAVQGKDGLTDHIMAIETAFHDKLWILDKSINALSTTQVSKLAQHEKTVAALKTIIVAALAFCAGGSITPNPWLGAIGLGVLGVGVIIGMLFTWLFSKKD